MGDLRYPAPGLPRTIVAPPQNPQQPTSNVNVILPQPNPAIVQQVFYNFALRTTGAQASSLFWWPRGTPISARVVNGLDVVLRCRLYSNNQQTSGVKSSQPIVEWDVGPGETSPPVVADPGRGDAWAAWSWVEIEAQSTPTNGAVTVDMIRDGEL